ncbi:type VI secretion system baseplate subunit TssF [Geomonas sp. RF6]|uniref:type VI secretion system baseplate subunit TssF n=1 Tax=Geomonas sp. RF6 TaxID=2897342 RepID=UPI001E329602|nr:type VI secretion system baseplate subunit TssF [Geomonas sp. RF6]UFS70714.1 type VI secretion system baseplate subunit TssF [Geomonas sp. RF6]
MGDELLHYYERELAFMRAMGAEFAARYPMVAARLQLEGDRCGDPHTERLIEAFSFLSGRIHKKIDDHFPEITESLFQVLYPHYVAPVPSMSVVCFDPVRQAIPATGYTIEKGTVLYSKPVNGFPCQFSTGYPVMLWPVEVLSATVGDPGKLVAKAQQAIVIGLGTTNGAGFSELDCRRLRFFLNGSPQHVYHLYEALLNNVCHIELSWRTPQGRQETVALTPGEIRPVGFNAEEALVPLDGRSYSAYHLLFEYFSFPEKFLFLDLSGLEKLSGRSVGDRMEISFILERARPNLVVTKETFTLGATPVINVFKRTAEPIQIDHQRTEYQVIPDLRRAAATEVFMVERVVSSVVGSDRETVYRPLYSLDHHAEEGRAASRAYWHLKRQPSGRDGDDGTDVYLSFVDLDFDPTSPGAEVVHVQVSCTNRDLPARIPIGGTDDFETELAAPVRGVRCLVKPTPPRRPALGGELQWRLISHLSLNYLSLLNGNGEALKEILRLYDFDNSPATRQQISGIVGIRSEYVTKRISSSFCRGVSVTVTFDEEKYVGTGLFLFASVIERFLGEYVSINSFVRMTAETLQRKEKLKEWPPRNGHRMLL